MTVNHTTLLPNAIITSHASLTGCPVSEENAERVMLDPTSRDNLKFKDLLKVQWDHTIKENIRDADDQNVCLQVLIDWINSELEEERIIVKDLEEDCYDGQVLQKLFGEKQPFGTRMKLSGILDRKPLRVLMKFALIPSPVLNPFISVRNRKAVGQKTERGRGDAVRDRPKTEAADGFGGCERAAASSRLAHRVECGLWVWRPRAHKTAAHDWIFPFISALNLAAAPQPSIQRTWWPSFICWWIWRCTSRPPSGCLSTCLCRWW